jgi:hypothetical protein
MPKKIKGDLVNAYLDTAVSGAPVWKLVACITTSDIDGTRETIDANSKCGTDTLSGQKTETANFAGFFITDPTVDQVSMNTIAAAFDDGLQHHWKFATADETVYYREFDGSITAYNESSNINEAVTFTAAVSITGDIIRTAPTT